MTPTATVVGVVEHALGVQLVTEIPGTFTLQLPEHVQSCSSVPTQLPLQTFDAPPHTLAQHPGTGDDDGPAGLHAVAEQTPLQQWGISPLTS